MAKTILVVEDDPTQRRLIQAVLERDGYAVVHAAGGGEAIDRMTRGGGADLILLDMVMPEMSGLECLAELRSAGRNAALLPSARRRRMTLSRLKLPSRNNKNKKSKNIISTV